MADISKLIVGDKENCDFSKIMAIISKSKGIVLLREKLALIGNRMGINTFDLIDKINKNLMSATEALEYLLIEWRSRAIHPDHAKLILFIDILRDVGLCAMAGDLEKEYSKQESTLQCGPSGQHNNVREDNISSTSSNVQYVPAQFAVNININRDEDKVVPIITTNPSNANIHQEHHTQSSTDASTENPERTEPQVAGNCIPERKPLLSTQEGASDNPKSFETPNSACISRQSSTSTFKSQQEPSAKDRTCLSSEKILKTAAIVIVVFILFVIALCWKFLPDGEGSDSIACPEELYTRQKLSVHSSNYPNYSEEMENASNNFVSTQIELSLYFNDTHDSFLPPSNLFKAETVTELKIYGNACTHDFYYFLRQTACVREIHLNKVVLETCKMLAKYKNQTNDNVTLSQVKTLVIHGIRDGNVHHIQHLIAHSRNLQYLEISGLNSAKDPFYNISFPAMSLRHLVWNQSADSQLTGSDVLQINPYFSGAVPNIEIFESEQGVVRYDDRLNLFSCKNLTKLSVRIRISSEDMLDIGNIGIISRLTKLKELKLYLLFGGSECPTLEEINVLGLKDLADNFDISIIKSNCEIAPGSASIVRKNKREIFELNDSVYEIYG